ncbi:MAG: right-handed parallel beta-helix repeat-containing protein [Candidatus Eisenbacteria bacterium]|uniref:Right-handed parallel beta-helix repeat-containing protein n=1 Tax=Eiseniibacteriota bacterium TaxID=2212470 RepID=A0A956SD42_UNCEI|nr:right-handed parallel beta-helix repeat-containing protein [Candidatus Eisenbacteria bacterium]
MKRWSLPLALLGLCATNGWAATHVVEADGSGDFPTIQAAIEASSDGDIIELGPGTYLGAGNRDVDFLDRSLTVRSRSGASSCVVDCEGTAEAPHRGFVIDGPSGKSSTIEGVTIQGGHLSGTSTHGGAILVDGTGNSLSLIDCVLQDNQTTAWGGAIAVVDRATLTAARCELTRNQGGRGGAIAVSNNASAEISGSTIESNTALRGGGAFASTTAELNLLTCLLVANVANGTGVTDRSGGAVHCSSSTLTIDHCTVVSNQAVGSAGGAVYAQLSTFDISQSTFWANAADAGAGLACALGGTGTVENTILAGGTEGGSVDRGPATVTFTCSDIFGNVGGDWVGGIEEQFAINGNIALDPVFCDPDGGDFGLGEGSPCAAASNPTCGRIGAQDERCQLDPVHEASWGQVKSLFR